MTPPTGSSGPATWPTRRRARRLFPPHGGSGDPGSPKPGGPLPRSAASGTDVRGLQRRPAAPPRRRPFLNVPELSPLGVRRNPCAHVYAFRTVQALDTRSDDRAPSSAGAVERRRDGGYCHGWAGVSTHAQNPSAAGRLAHLKAAAACSTERRCSAISARWRTASHGTFPVAVADRPEDEQAGHQGSPAREDRDRTDRGGERGQPELQGYEHHGAAASSAVPRL